MTVSLNDGAPQEAHFTGKDKQGSELFAVDLTQGPLQIDPSHPYAVVGQPFHFQVRNPVSSRFHIVSAPVQLSFNGETGEGRWTATSRDTGRVDVELADFNAPAGHLTISFLCYRFNAPRNATVQVVDQTLRSDPHDRPRFIRSALVSWLPPEFADELAGFNLKLINIDTSQSREWTVHGYATATVLPDIAPGPYQLSIIPIDPQGAQGLSSDLHLTVEPPGGSNSSP
jgi:hypothetical protein